MKFNTAFFLALPMMACSDVKDSHDHDHHHHEHEVMTTVQLEFTPTEGDALTFTWDEVEQDGDPAIDSVLLAVDTEYMLKVFFKNRLEDPEEDITPEISDESEEHQVFFTGDAVSGPSNTDNADALLTQAYADEDENGFPLGLENNVTTIATGTKNLEVTLRHMPPESGNPIKLEDLAGTVDSEGFSAIGGANDVSVIFPVTVE